MNKRIWIDPPSGWKYGFPKIKDDDSDTIEWLVKNGYPKEDIDKLGKYFYTRQWEATDNEIGNDNG